ELLQFYDSVGPIWCKLVVPFAAHRLEGVDFAVAVPGVVLARTGAGLRRVIVDRRERCIFGEYYRGWAGKRIGATFEQSLQTAVVSSIIVAKTPILAGATHDQCGYARHVGR